MFQCGELLSRFSTRRQWRRWRVLLRQTGRAQLRQENQRLVVPVVSPPPPVCPHPPVPHLAAPAIPVPSSFTSLLGCHPETSTLSWFGCQALVANCVCLCSSDCESREVLTLLCQGETFTNVCYHCPTHCGHSLILFHTLSSSFSCDLCRSFSCCASLHILSGVFLSSS